MKKKFQQTWDYILAALAIIGEDRPNCLFVAADVNTDYLHFHRIDMEEYNEHSDKFDELGVVWVPKFETLAIDRNTLWDLEHAK